MTAFSRATSAVAAVLFLSLPASGMPSPGVTVDDGRPEGQWRFRVFLDGKRIGYEGPANRRDARIDAFG